MKALLEIKALRRGKSGDTIILVEEPIDRLPPKVEMRGGAKDGQVASAKSMRFDREAGKLTLVDADSGEVVLECDGELALTDSWAPDDDSDVPKGSCRWSFDTVRLAGDTAGMLFGSSSLRASWKPLQNVIEFDAARKTA